jgi:acyl-CoA synthetase (AMP-forming)/AMP-acid ligase II
VNLAEVAPPPGSPVSPHLLDEATTLTAALGTLADTCPDFPCLTILDRRRREQVVSFGALWDEARRVQSRLLDAGAGPGAFVLLVLPTGPELLAGYFGAMLAGCIPGLVATPSNRVADPGVYAGRVGAILENADARVLYTDDEVAGLMRAAGVPALARVQVLSPSDAGRPDVSAARPAPDDVATVQYSSGSTGIPKGILLTHRAMLNNIRAVRDGLGVTPRDVSVNWIPLYHDMGLIDAFLLPLLSGCPTILIPTMDFMREPALWLWAMHHYRGTLSWAPNFAYTLCARRVPDAELTGLDLSSWRVAINAAESVLATTIDDFARRFTPHGFYPAAMTPAWGLAENVTIATAHPVEQAPTVERIDRQALAQRDVAETSPDADLPSVAIGRCLPHCEVEIRDAGGRALADRHVGAVWLRTDSLFVGYHRDPERTAAALQDGWLDTGDVGYLAAGNLFFVARDKDLIVIGGEKYAPHDVEAAINAVPGVRTGCAVAFGVLDETRGTEDVAAVVETRVEDQTERAALGDAIRASVADATGLGLRHLLLVPPGGIEKTTSGKLARRATRTRWTERLASAGGPGAD